MIPLQRIITIIVTEDVQGIINNKIGYYVRSNYRGHDWFSI